MALFLNSAAPNFSDQFERFLHQNRDDSADVQAVVRDILSDVRENGFDAVARYTQQFDAVALTPENARFDVAAFDAAEAACDADDLAALDFAAARIRAFHEKQLPQDMRYTDDAGVTLGWRWTPVDAAGLYAPGGRAAYPSSVLMNAIPAKIAGVGRLVLVTPTPKGEVNPLVLAAAKRAGVDEVYCIGGAQAVGALAYGAGPIAPVDLIVGPGNAYVAEAKRQVFGVVGIDSIAGPSEILVIADKAQNPAWVATDLLSQAEHDPSSQSVLISDDDAFAKAVGAEVDAQLAAHPRAKLAGAAWADNSAIIVARDLREAAALSNKIAPEHLELCVTDPEALLGDIRHAGAIFLGAFTPEAVGDYVAGPDHVLPTSRSARFASGLSVLDFVKRSTILGCSPAALAKIGPAAARLADAEGLPSHAQSVRIRLQG